MKTVTRRMAKLALRKYVAEMAEEWCIPCDVRFRNASLGSWARTRESEGSVISFGMRGALRWARHGFTEEFRGVQHLIKGHRKGKRSLRYLAAHEFAHVLTDNMRDHYVSPHGREWREAYELLLNLHMPGYDRSNGHG